MTSGAIKLNKLNQEVHDVSQTLHVIQLAISDFLVVRKVYYCRNTKPFFYMTGYDCSLIAT